MKNLLLILAAAGGAGFIGYKIGHTQAKKKYENLADIEVESVKAKLKDYYEGNGSIKKIKKESKKDISADVKVPTLTSNKPLNEPAKMIQDYGGQYRQTNTAERIVGEPTEEQKYLKKEEVDATKPYVITPEEFNDSNYELTTIFYFADKVLTDDDMNIISDINIIGGYDNLNQIGMYEPDCIHVRDDKLGVDYEVLLDERTYTRVRPGVEAVEED